MFDNLTDKLQSVFKKLTGKGRLSPQDVATACREVRLALLEADVNFHVVKDFVAHVQEKATGKEVLESVTPGQQVIKIVHDELVALLGGESETQPEGTADIYMLVGLQGGGKTTTSAKLGLSLQKKGRKPLLAATDLRRPAAIEQLATIGSQVGLPVFEPHGEKTSLEVAQAALKHSRAESLSPVIIDTQGRAHVDEELMGELAEMRAALPAADVLLVLDAMTGQEAVKVAQAFENSLDLSGFILTKLDGDARGGAALSLRAVVGKPIWFVGTGEKPEALEPFLAERMASRILGMGDVLTLVEKAEEAISEEEARALEEKVRRHRFDLNDLLEQCQRISKMGSLDHLVSLIPGMGGLGQQLEEGFDQKALARMTAIIQSMTPRERSEPDIIKGSHRRRIAKGSGSRVEDVNFVLAQFKQIRQMLAGLTEKKPFGKKGFTLPQW
ncbi:MAG: signal recognition particle protein [Armatimonadetes bacterium]|nr:signal recognition particle protein [Armatimonadota bacterium]NIO76148.1 signal recognition particle protein [Armatimonadota bacterium]NIO98844.1 signal recognition particle protein [Armatimonadota bacterium]